ncbi:MAG: hypothetical protein KGL31_01750 [candidate division NC10 bacterium]|nr:hypothetical protein [candidate division NC10 bacterium]MDE2320629.1 hypothetical protein [candidate division NC10 bacterium]
MDQYELIRTAARVYKKSIRQIARETGHTRKTVRKVLAGWEPKYRRRQEPGCRVMAPVAAIIDGWLQTDQEAPTKQRHTAHRIWTRLVDEYGFTGAESTVRRWVREQKARRGWHTVTAVLPLDPEIAREAEVDWGTAWVRMAGEEKPVRLFCMRSRFSGLAGIVVITIVLRMTLGLEQWITPVHFHDLGKLLFSFDMLVIGLVWAQYIVIWYGNITEETQYVILRTQVLPWALFSWVALMAGFLGPLVVFFSRRAKQDPFALLPMGLAIAGGMWVERYVLVVPALWKGPAAPLGLPELLISAGFASAAILCYLAFIRFFPIFP